MPVIYSSHVGRHFVAIVYCPRIAAGRLIHLSQDGPHSWALRDFITGMMIRNTPSPNAATSHHTLAEIEAEVTHSEEPDYLAVSNAREWKRILETRTRQYLGKPPSIDLPNPEFGDWRRFA